MISMEKNGLIALYDFENRELVFPDVDGRFKFCVLLMGGSNVPKRHRRTSCFLHTKWKIYGSQTGTFI